MSEEPSSKTAAARASGGAGVALVSGGSSGIGFAAARSLLGRGFSVVLAARDKARLEAAAAQLQSGVAGAQRVHVRALDVTDTDACAALVAEVEAAVGPIEVLVTSAGIAVPGLFVEQPLADHLRQMQVNYIGTLALVHALAPRMRERRRGRLVLIASGAGLAGVYGYSAYAPSKFAVRGLGETLRAELAEHGISVSVAFPPDTDTPQLAAEQATRPAVTKAISAGGGLFSSDAVAERIVGEALKGRFAITHGLPLFALRWLHSLYGPLFIRGQMKIARRFAQSNPSPGERNPRQED